MLAQLDVEASDQHFAYRLKKEMLRSISIDPSADQSLSVSAKLDRTGLAIEQNDSITRVNMTAKTDYALALRERQSGSYSASAKTGSTTVTTAVNTTSSQFATTVSEKEAVDRLAKETALRLLTFLRLNRSTALNGE